MVRVARTLTAGGGQQGDEGTWARRRIERLEKRVGELERELSRARAQSRTIAEERDALRAQLANSEGNLALLTERLSAGKQDGGPVSKRLRADERALLHQLRRSGAGGLPNRAS